MSENDESQQTPNGDSGVITPSNVVDLEIENELRDSYLTYAMSTIMDRALPDVRDGLKPSQRRILVAMNDLNLRPNRKHLKCAKIAGNTSGDYHPHGESVIYPTMVGMAQGWKMRVPLIDPQGNFGSIEGDPPAAMRYTEARMTHGAMDMLADIKLDTVDFQPNYDDRLNEPTVLPGKFPNLLINGGMGIAVGMATSLPPHNPDEIFDAITRVIDDPDISLADIMTDETDEDGNVTRLGVKGPDFPTGGVILGRRGIMDAYSTGRGRVTVRGVCHVEESGGRQALVIDQIPYSLVQNNLVEKIVEAAKEDRIKDIADVRNESGRNAQTRIVIELKKAGDPAVVENQLYQFTPLQQTFSMIHIALVGRRPRTLTLLEMLQLYIDHRVDVVRRRTAHLLREAKKKAHVLEGMIFAVCDIDEVIAIIRGSKTREEAIQKLVEKRFRIPADHPHAPKIPERMMQMVRAGDEAGGVLLTRVQAETIGNMRLIQLTGLEIERLVKDYAELVAEIEGYELILSDHQRVLDILKEDCLEMKERYNSPRLTDIQDAAGDIDLEALIKEHEVTVTISHQGYAKRLPLDTYRSQGRGGKGIRASESKDDDFIERVFVASTHADLLVFTDQGRVFKLKVYELPEMSRTSKGRSIVNLVNLRESERARVYLTIDDFEDEGKYLTFVSKGGIVKRTPLRDYQNVNRSGLIAVGVKEGDEILNVLLTDGSDDLMIVTDQGMAIRFNEGDVRLMGRSAAGVKGIDLSGGSIAIAADRVPMEPDPKDDEQTVTIEPAHSLLTVTEHGYGKRTLVDEYRVQPETGPMRSQSRGGKGRKDIRFTTRNGPSVAACIVADTDDIVVISRKGQLVRMAVDSISQYSRGTQGVRVVGLKDGDSVVAVARVAESAVSEPETETSQAESE
ncbi:MAG: DNA gyrase subunit A [Phycisphaera sp.]|nr:MAG: DNA gyrase subunit A [Phycisphaera sp.]